MYVIFPLEDLLDPHSGLRASSASTQNAQRATARNNGGSCGEVLFPPPFRPFHTLPPPSPSPGQKQPAPQQQNPKIIVQDITANSNPSITITGDSSRSGSFRPPSRSSSVQHLEQPQAGRVVANLPHTGKLSAPAKLAVPTVSLTVPGSNALPLLQISQHPSKDQILATNTLQLQQQQRSQTQQQPTQQQKNQLKLQEASVQQTNILQPQQSLQNKGQKSKANVNPKPKSQSFSSITANFCPVSRPSSASRQDFSSGCQPVVDREGGIGKLADSDSKEVVARNRYSWPSNVETRLSTPLSPIILSSSVRSKEFIRPSAVSPEVSIAFLGEETPSSRRRKTALVSPLGLPKDLVITQKSVYSGAKDCGISAKEFNHNASGSDVTIGSRESAGALHVRSPIGVGNRTGGLVPERSFGCAGDLATLPPIKPSLKLIRSVSSVETSGGAVLGDCGSGSGGRVLRYGSNSTRSSSSSARSRISETIRTKQQVPEEPLEYHSYVKFQSPEVGGGVGGRSGPNKFRMATSSGDAGLRLLTHPALNEPLKAHNNVTFKLLKTVSDFSGQLSRLHEHHAEQLQHLVHTFRKKNSELRNERPTPGGPIAMVWESLLQEVEIDSQLHVDVAATLTRDVAKPLVENTFYRKIEARKVFAHRESFEGIISKAEEQLKKNKREYTEAYRIHCSTMTNGSLAEHLDAHNAYVTQLRATNGMLTEYHTNILPSLLQELEMVLTDVGNIASSSIQQASEIIADKTGEQHQRYTALSKNCRNLDGRADTITLVKNLDIPHPPRPLHRFSPPQLTQPQENEEGAGAQQGVAQPTYHNEVVEDRLASVSPKAKIESLRQEATELARQVQKNQETHEGLLKAQQRSLDAGHHNKANEIQEDISLKLFDIRVAQLHLGAVKAQKELFSPREGTGVESRDRKMSGSSTGSMKSKWMKAFKSLKTSSSSSSNPPKESAAGDKRTGGRSGELSPPILESSHIFQEYTYKKISACDVCHQILKGHTRQGLKCKLCKVSVHPDCQSEAPRCQPKSRLLRRQRSTSEIEVKHIEADEDEGEPPNLSFNSFIASQPGRRQLEPPSPTIHGPHDQGGKRAV